MEEKVPDILRNAPHEEKTPRAGLGSEIASLFRGIGLDAEIPELRGSEVKPITFDREGRERQKRRQS
jgi:hypothetical protein